MTTATAINPGMTWAERRRCGQVRAAAAAKLRRRGLAVPCNVTMDRLVALVEEVTGQPPGRDPVQYLLDYSNRPEGAAPRTLNLMGRPEWNPLADPSWRRMLERLSEPLTLAKR